MPEDRFTAIYRNASVFPLCCFPFSSPEPPYAVKRRRAGSGEEHFLSISFSDRQRRNRRCLSGEEKAAFSEAVRNCIDTPHNGVSTPNRENGFRREKDSEAAIHSNGFAVFFVIFLLARRIRNEAVDLLSVFPPSGTIDSLIDRKSVV